MAQSGLETGSVGQGTQSRSLLRQVLVPTGIVGGILLAVFLFQLPCLMSALQRSKQKRTMADLWTVGEEQAAHHKAVGAYLKGAIGPVVDGWGRPLRFEVTEGSYAVTSSGKDGKFEHARATDYAEGVTKYFDCDIVYANGSFFSSPEGIARR